MILDQGKRGDPLVDWVFVDIYVILDYVKRDVHHFCRYLHGFGTPSKIYMPYMSIFYANLVSFEEHRVTLCRYLRDPRLRKKRRFAFFVDIYVILAPTRRGIHHFC